MMRIRKLIEGAIAEVKLSSIRIENGYYGVDFMDVWHLQAGKSCCPIGAVLLTHQPPPNGGGYISAAATVLGVDQMWINSFTRGFDYSYAQPKMRSSWAYKMGRHFRYQLFGEIT